jgi:anti-sigma factor RsiW
VASCTQVESLVQAFLDGELADSERTILEEHVSHCGACEGLVKRQRQSAAQLFEAFREDRLEADMTAAVMAHLPEMESFRTVQEVNWRVKEGARRRPSLFNRLMPIAVPALLLVVAIAMYSVWPVTELEAATAIGVVTYRAGDVQSSLNNGVDNRSVFLKAMVAEGERFELGEHAAMMMSLAGPSRVKADEASRFTVRTDRALSISKGRVWFDVARDERQFRVNTPSGDITVFGTTFEVMVEDNRTVVTVKSGKVRVENNVAFVELIAGDQVSVQAGQTPLLVNQVDVNAQMAWADEIGPSPDAEALFTEHIRARSTEQLKAEQAFVVVTKADGRRRAISSIVLEWEPDGLSSGHSGYYLYVKDNRMQPLFKEHVSADVFDDGIRNTYQIAVPGSPIQDVDILLIQIVPDYSSGRVETSFTDVKALGV